MPRHPWFLRAARSAPSIQHLSRAMAPHLTPAELDRMSCMASKGHAPVDIQKALALSRAKRDEAGPDLTTVRRALRGCTHKRGPVESRGRKMKITPTKLASLNNARKRLIKDAKGEREVHLADIMSAARVKGVHSTTVSKGLKGKFKVTWRPPRSAPLRTSLDCSERVKICQKWKHLPTVYFSKTVDAILDNKTFDVPTYARARLYAKVSRVRGHLRTRAEGVQTGFTKPKGSKHRLNPHGKVGGARPHAHRFGSCGTAAAMCWVGPSPLAPGDVGGWRQSHTFGASGGGAAFQAVSTAPSR